MRDWWIPVVLTAASGYLLGSINSAVIVSRWLKKADIRRFGSQNAGMTNMYRVFGKKAALLTLPGDLLKAVAAVLLSRHLFTLFNIVPGFDPGFLAGLFVLIGHIYPVWFGFKGGKGVLPAVGIILMVDPVAFGILAAIALLLFSKTRTMSLVSVTNAAVLPIVILLLRLAREQEPWVESAFALAFSILVIYSHRSNIRRLLNRSESPLIQSDQSSEQTKKQK